MIKCVCILSDIFLLYKGADVVQVTPNCMKALGSVTPMPDPELYVYANRLVDKFYGEATQELHG